MAACPCVGSSDCIANEIVDDELISTPIIAPDPEPGDQAYNALDCTSDGLLALVAAGPGLSAVTLDPDPGVRIDLDTQTAVTFDNANGTNVGVINGTPSGQVGPTLFLNCTNPSSERTALLLGLLHYGSEGARIGSGGVWHFHYQFNIDGGVWQQAAFRAYDRRHPFNAGVTALESAGGDIMTPVTLGMAPSQVIVLGMRVVLIVTQASANGESFLDNSGSLFATGYAFVV